MKRLALGLFLWMAVGGCDRVDAPEAPRRWQEPVTGMEFVWISAGRFAMGSPESEFGREAQEALHEVRLTRPFYMARHEVTQGEWRRVMGRNPSRARDCGDDCPVEGVSFLDIEKFLDRLQELSGERLRLPSEAEWEYACRAGSTSAFPGAETLSADQANFDASVPYPGAAPGPRSLGPVPVGSYAANAWGLYDLQGNVWEWTLDHHCPYEGAAVDPRGHCASALMVIRGGSWLFGADSSRCGLRYTHRPQDSGPSLGFRLVRDPPARAG
jgi:formylglycine-generating enzyme required for sulfatase activity